MLPQRSRVGLYIRNHPGGANPLRLQIHTGRTVRAFIPHIGETWERIVRPRAGGSPFLALGRYDPALAVPRLLRRR